MKKINADIFFWYKKHGRKNLPWQKTNCPYKIWISEIMLQQTQVKTVIPYYKKFIIAFPNIQSLSKANEDYIMHLWAGLGFYKRAKNIYKTAQIIMKEYHGIFPNDIKKIIKFPGIGRTTAAAIVSSAFNIKEPILDTNIIRIITRYYYINKNINLAKTKKILWNIVSQNMPDNNYRMYNQALMDLGALICQKKPNCIICPIKKNCLSYKKNDFFINKKNIKIKEKKIKIIVLQNKNNFLFNKRNNKTYWNNLFMFPIFNLKNIFFLLTKDYNPKIYYYKKIFLVKFSHIKLFISIFYIRYDKDIEIPKEKNFLLENIENKKKIGFPPVVKKIIKDIIYNYERKKIFLYKIKKKI